MRGLFVVLFLVLTGPTFGQGNASQRLGFKVTIDKTAIKIGDTIEMTFKAPIPEHFHVYSEKSDCPGDDGPIRADMRFDHEDGIMLFGGLMGVGDVMVADTEVWNCSTGEFDKVCEFRQKAVIKGELHGLTAHFYGQRCSLIDGVCYLVSEDIPIALEVTLK